MSLRRSIVIGVAFGIALLAAAVGIVIWWETSGSWREQPVSSAELRGDRTAVLWLGCFPDTETRVSTVERTGDVTVTVEIKGERSSGDCLSGVEVAFDEPLGGRTLVDGATGDPISIE